MSGLFAMGTNPPFDSVHSHPLDSDIAISGDKRKCVFDQEVTPNRLYACQNILCPELGFTDKSTRSDHESGCSYRESSEESEHSDRNLVPYDHHTDSTNDAEKILAVTDWLDMEVASAKANERQGNMQLNEVGDLQDYLKYLEDVPLPTELLFQRADSELSSIPFLAEMIDDIQGSTSVWDMGFDGISEL